MLCECACCCVFEFNVITDGQCNIIRQSKCDGRSRRCVHIRIRRTRSAIDLHRDLRNRRRRKPVNLHGHEATRVSVNRVLVAENPFVTGLK
jgi:hypothetical protein